jgi:hypothetical protein
VSRRAMLPAVRPVAAVLALVVCAGAVLAFYRWTAHSTGIPVRFSDPVSEDRYNQQVDSFKDGRLDLELPVPPGLNGLRDPYDPKANAPFRAAGYQDLVFHGGKLYIYWGPTPALTLFWPSRALGIGRFPQVYAVALFAALAFLCAAGLLLVLARRLVPGTPLWMQAVGILVLGMGSVWPWLIRRPDVYEVSIAAGCAFMFAGFLLLALGGLGARARPVLLGLGALCIGLAAGSRASFGAAAIAPLALLLWRRRRDAYRRWIRLVAWTAVPLIACGVALMVYNQRRFGSPLDFGHEYLLVSPDDAVKGPSLANVPTGLWFYLFGELHLFPAFPFFHIEPPASAPFHIPATWAVRDRSAGLVTLQPFLLALGGLGWLWSRLRPAAVVAVVLAGLGALLLVFDAYYINGITQRYEADFAPLMLCAALLCWYGLRAALPAGLVRMTATWVGAALALFGAAAGLLLSMSGPDATLPLGWEHLAPHLMFLAPVARSFGFIAALHEARLLLAVIVCLAAVTVAVGWAARRFGLVSSPRAAWAARFTAAAGAALALLAILLARDNAAEEAFGTGRSVALGAGLVLAAIGGTLAALATPAARGPGRAPARPAPAATTESPAPRPPSG